MIRKQVQSEDISDRGEVMSKFSLTTIVILGIALTTCAYGFESGDTTLKNKDFTPYKYQIRIAGGGIIADDGTPDDNRVVYDSGVGYGKIEENSEISICETGCALTLTKTGQTITVKPGDRIVIENGVMRVQKGNLLPR